MQYRISSSQPVICLFWLLLVLSLSSTSIYASEDYIEEDYQEYYDEDYDYEDDLASGDTAPSGLVMNSVTRNPKNFVKTHKFTNLCDFTKFIKIYYFPHLLGFWVPENITILRRRGGGVHICLQL